MNSHTQSVGSTVEAWFYQWLQRHMVRCPSQGWLDLIDGAPDEKATHFYTSWIRAFREHGLTEPVADECSMLLAQTKYSWPSGKHLNELLEHTRAAWDRVRASQQGVDLSIREGCPFQSRGCPECNGEGWAAREMVRVAQVYSVALFCMCPLGEWLAQHYFTQKEQEIYRRTRRLAQYPELWNTGFEHRSWPREPVHRPWPLESWWREPWIYVPPGQAGFDRGKTGSAVKTVSEGLSGQPF